MKDSEQIDHRSWNCTPAHLVFIFASVVMKDSEHFFSLPDDFVQSNVASNLLMRQPRSGAEGTSNVQNYPGW